MLCVTELELYAELSERVDRAHYKKVYESMKTRQEQDGTLEYVSAIVERLVGKPSDARHDWPNCDHLKDAIKEINKKLPGYVKVPTNPKRGVLIQLIAMTWRNLPPAQRPALRMMQPRLPVQPQPSPPPGHQQSYLPLPMPPPPPGPPPPGPPPLLATLLAPPPRPPPPPPPLPSQPPPPLPPAPAPPPPQAEHDLLNGAYAADDSVGTTVADDIFDDEEIDAAEEAQLQAEEAAAEAVVETVARVIFNDCPKCGRRIPVAEMVWDDSRWANVCSNDSACVPITEGGRKRARPQVGSFAKPIRRT